MSSGKRTRKRASKSIAVILMCVVGTLGVLGLVGYGVWNMLVVPPDVSDKIPTLSPVGGSNDRADSGAEGQSGAESETEVVNTRKENFYTFLLLGKDTGGGGNTDTMLLVSYDVAAQTIDVLTIPRDTMINVPWTIKKINAVYASSRGLEGLKTQVGYLTGIVPDFYIIVEWEAVGEIVNALGGVYFDVPYHMDYDDPYQDLYIHQEKGYRLLSGEDAMQVIRWRANNDGSPYGYYISNGGIGDTGRQKIQRSFLKAVAQQCLQIKNWTKISDFVSIFAENVETDIPWNNLLWFAEQAMDLEMEHIAFHAMPGNPEGWYYTPSLGVNLNYFFADPEGIVELVNAHFNPYTLDFQIEDLQIVFKNEDASLGVTSGELADPKMAIPSVKPPSAPKPDKNEAEDPGADEPTIPDGGEETSTPENAETAGDGEEPTIPDTPPENENGDNSDDMNA